MIFRIEQHQETPPIIALEISISLLSLLLVLNKPSKLLSFRFTNRDIYYQDIDNVYELKLYNRFPSLYERVFPKKSLVEFARAENIQDLKHPNATLLDCHYRLAEILNASGMARLVDNYLWDYGYIEGSPGRWPDIARIVYLACWGDGVG